MCTALARTPHLLLVGAQQHAVDLALVPEAKPMALANGKPQVDAISRPGAARRFWAGNDLIQNPPVWKDRVRRYFSDI